MSPLLLGAAWLLFVISCLASMTPTGPSTARSRKPSIKPANTGGRDETT